MNQLLDKLKAEDKFMLRISKGIQIVYYILTPFYAGFYAINPGGELTPLERIGGGCFVVSFVIFIIIFRWKVREYKTIDYSLPLVEMLEKAVKRYQLWKPDIIWALAAIIFVDAGLTMSTFAEFDSISPIMRIMKIQAIMIPLFVGAILAGMLWWYLKYKPIRDRAIDLLKELRNL